MPGIRLLLAGGITPSHHAEQGTNTEPLQNAFAGLSQLVGRQANAPAVVMQLLQCVGNAGIQPGIQVAGGFVGCEKIIAGLIEFNCSKRCAARSKGTLHQHAHAVTEHGFQLRSIQCRQLVAV